MQYLFNLKPKHGCEIKKNVIVIVDYDIVYSKKWDYEIWYDGTLRVSSFERYDSYEEALEKGLKEAIDFI